MTGRSEKKNITKSKIVKYIIHNRNTSKVELSKNLNLSMPTVLNNVNELIERNIVIESGEYESTGGRKAKRISMNPSYRYSMGIMITANHIAMILLNFNCEIEKMERTRLKFSPDMDYFMKLSEMAHAFLEDMENPENLLGIGISIPGILNQEERMILKSHALQLENYSLSFLERIFSVPVHFENDANAAMLAEDLHQYRNAVYLSLNNTLGGAFCIDGKLFCGQNQKAGEFGHMILVPGGKRCYCGKKGCADAYCAASVLTGESGESLETFMKQAASGNPDMQEKWETYLENLAVLISNIRMAYDTDIILGGEAGGYLQDYMIPLGEKVMKYNGFDLDIRYLKNCSYKREASAVGVAKYFIQEFIETI